jgi:hypothetical protein
MPDKNMQKLISALTLLGVIRPESLPTVAETSSYHSENAQVQRIEYQREAQRRNHYNNYDYDDNYEYDKHYNHEN